MAPPPKQRPGTGELLRRWEADKKSRIFLQLAEEYRKQDFIDAAVSVLRDGLKHHPNFQPAHVALARCFMSKRQWTEAQTELERVHSKSPDNLLAGKLLVEVLEGRGEKSRALEIARQLVPFAGFDDPEVAATAKRLEQELAGPVVKIASSAVSTGAATTGSGDTMEFGGDSTQDVAPAQLLPEDDDSAVLLDADAFAEVGEAEGPLASAAASARTGLDAETTHDELDAESTFAGIEDSASSKAADSESTREGPGARKSEPFGAAPSQRTAARHGSAEDLLGDPLPAGRADIDEDDLTSLTLAELYEAQDSPHEAAAIYEKLLRRRPDDARLRASLEACRLRIAGPGSGEADPLAAEEPNPQVPKWEPAPARPVPPAARARSARQARPEHLRAMLVEYERWLGAVRSVRR